MCKLHLTVPHTIEKDGKEIVLNQPLYNISDEKLIKDNKFFKCCKCKDYFDVAYEFNFALKSEYEDLNGSDYCVTCYDKAWSKIQLD